MPDGHPREMFRRTSPRFFGRWCFGVRRCRAVSLVADARWPSAPASKSATTYRPSNDGAQWTFGRDGRPGPPLTPRRAKVRARMEMPACRSDRGVRSALEEIEDYFSVACWVRPPNDDGVWEVREEFFPSASTTRTAKNPSLNSSLGAWPQPDARPGWQHNQAHISSRPSCRVCGFTDADSKRYNMRPYIAGTTFSATAMPP